MELGKKLIGEHPRGQVVVFTDGCQADVLEETSSDFVADPLAAVGTLNSAAADASKATTANEFAENALARIQDASKPTDVAVDLRIFGKRSANVGITQFQVRRSLIDPIGYQVLAAVHNASDQPVKCRLEIELNEAPVDVVPLNLEPDESWSRSIEKTSLEGGTLVGRLTESETTINSQQATDTAGSERPDESAASSNCLTCDDMAQAILPAREIQSVLVVTKGNLFLRKVFEANPLVRVSVSTDFPNSWPQDTIVVFDREVPNRFPANDVFVVDPVASCDLWELGDLLRDPIVTDQDEDSPLMKYVRLDNVLMPEARQITIKGKSRTLAGALSTDPVYAEVQRESGGKCLVLTVNLEKSDLAFRTAFPIMVANALGWFAGTSGELREAMSTGQTVSFPWESQIGRELRLMSPDSSVSVIPGVASEEVVAADETMTTNTSISDAESLMLGPFERAGIWSVHEADASNGEDVLDTFASTNPPLARFAVNVANQRETDLRPPEALLEKADAKPLASGLFARPVWFYLVAVGCLLSVVEWFLCQRRVIS